MRLRSAWLPAWPWPSCLNLQHPWAGAGSYAAAQQGATVSSSNPAVMFDGDSSIACGCYMS